MNRITLLYLLIVLTLIPKLAICQELPRSAAFGAMVSDLNDSTRITLQLPTVTGTILKKVVTGSSAHKADFLINDVLVSMDGEQIQNTKHFLDLLKKHHGGDKVKISFYRNSVLKETSMVLLPKPMENSADYEIIYSSVISGTNHLRTIITKPKSGNKFPAVLITGGVGCYSIDNISALELQSIKMWSDSLTRNGFVTIRVEKTGIGDSKGLACNECDFTTEKQGYLDGLKKLKALPYVDKENIFIAGFSIGGVIAPLIAQQESVKGIIVYGTVGRNWLEYELENTFRQQLLEDKSAEEMDQYMRAEYIRLYALFVEKKQPEQILKKHPKTAGHLLEYPMSTRYFQQVADVNIRTIWMNTKSKVLAMHGSSDFVSSATEHKLIAEIVNHYNPGNASYMEIANADHWSLFAESEMASVMQQQTGLNTVPLITSLKWLKAHS